MKHIIIINMFSTTLSCNLTHILTPSIFIHVKPRDKMYVENTRKQRRKKGTKSREITSTEEQRILLAN